VTLRTGYTGHDLSVRVLGADRRVEVKCRANGFRELYSWLSGVDLLVIRADRKEPLLVVPLALAAEGAKNHTKSALKIHTKFARGVWAGIADRVLAPGGWGKPQIAIGRDTCGLGFAMGPPRS
jgi:hypothetical protein